MTRNHTLAHTGTESADKGPLKRTNHIPNPVINSLLCSVFTLCVQYVVTIYIRKCFTPTLYFAMFNLVNAIGAKEIAT